MNISLIIAFTKSSYSRQLRRFRLARAKVYTFYVQAIKSIPFFNGYFTIFQISPRDNCIPVSKTFYFGEAYGHKHAKIKMPKKDLRKAMLP